MKVGDPLTKEDTLVEDPLMAEDPLEEDILMEMGDPLEEEDTLEEDPLMEEEDPWTSWRTRTSRPSRTPWTSETYNSPDPSSDHGYNWLWKTHLIHCWTVYVTIG